MAGADLAGLRAWARRSPRSVDWVLVGVSVLVWLVLLGFSVAATVALIDLARGFDQPTEDPHTGVLYIVIGVSALIILGAVPVLLRARQLTPQQHRPAAAPPVRAAGRPVTGGGGGRAAVSRPAPSAGREAAIERILLRGTAELASATGTALIAVAAATYLMALGKDTAAWAAYGVAGVVTVALPVVPWRYLRQLKRSAN